MKLFGEVKRAAMQSSAIDTNAVALGSAEIRERYFSTPLSAMKKDPVSYSDVVLRAADIIEKLEL